jgi:hypothetical protein
MFELKTMKMSFQMVCSLRREQKKGNKNNFNEILPVCSVGNEKGYFFTHERTFSAQKTT